MKAFGLSLLALNLCLIGCASRSRPAPAATTPAAVATSELKIPVLKELAGTQWIVIELGGESVVPAVEGWAAQSIEFDADGQRVTGHGGVNRFGGRYAQDKASLRFGPLALTRRAGPQAQMELEARYTAILSRVVGWRQDGLHVILVGAGDQRAALLEPVAKPKG